MRYITNRLSLSLVHSLVLTFFSPHFNPFDQHCSVTYYTMATAAVAIPPSNYGVPGSHMLGHVKLPEAPPKPSETIDPQCIATEWVAGFNDLINSQNTAAGELFLQDSYWRDLLCATWDYHTFQGLSKISSVLKGPGGRSRLTKLAVDTSSDFKKPSISPVDFAGNLQCVRAFLTVETYIGRGRGLVKLVRDVQYGGKWKAFVLFTTLGELKGHEESVYARRPSGVDHGAHPGRLNWQERRNAEANCEGPFEPTVLIIGMPSP